jgi:uncharacterized protein (DUF2147 family)
MIIPFKNRDIDFNSKVKIYRNLKAARDQRIYSIKQNGFVVAHTTNIVLRDCKLIVQEGSRQRLLKTGQRNVHAWICGFVDMENNGEKCTNRIVYNPKNNNSFMCGLKLIKHADVVLFNEHGVFITTFNDSNKLFKIGQS